MCSQCKRVNKTHGKERRSDYTRLEKILEGERADSYLRLDGYGSGKIGVILGQD